MLLVQALCDGSGGNHGVEALEIENVYDPQATGFADLNGAQPVFVVKSRITLERLGGGSK